MTATQPTWTKRTMFKISIALHLFRYAAPLNKDGNSNMAKISTETHTNGTPNTREWHSRRDITFHKKFYLNIFAQMKRSIELFLDHKVCTRLDMICMFGLVAFPFFLFIEKSFHVITQLGV